MKWKRGKKVKEPQSNDGEKEVSTGPDDVRPDGPTPLEPVVDTEARITVGLQGDECSEVGVHDDDDDDIDDDMDEDMLAEGYMNDSSSDERVNNPSDDNESYGRNQYPSANERGGLDCHPVEPVH